MQTAHAFKSAGRVLVVDDSPLILSVLRDKLSGHGYDVVTVGRPDEALDLAVRRTDRFDLFILDVRMPELDGYAMTRKLRGDPTTRNTPILLLTTLEASEDTVAGLEAGADDFLTKSVSDGELLARVRSLVSLGALRERLEGQHAVVGQLFGDKDKLSEAAGDPDTQPVVRILLAHPSAEVATLLRRLAARQPSYLVHEAPDAKLGQAELAWANVVLTDFDRVASGGMPPSGTGILVVDDTPSVERRIAALQHGVEDYVVVGTPVGEIAARISSIMRRQERLRSMEQARDQAVLAAITDPLTGLHNHGYFHEYLRSELLRSERYNEPFSVILLDIDHFKRVNDSYGHPVGDRVLREVSRRLREVVRATDLLARYGGEEFAIVLPHTSPEEGRRVADKIRRAFEAEPIRAKEQLAIPVTVSLGVGFCPLDGGNPAEILDRVDEALYAAKRCGRNRAVATTELGLTLATEPQPADPGARDRALAIVEEALRELAAGHPRDLVADLERVAIELRSERVPRSDD
jgi:two-component system cell cycle response regulator